MFQFQIQLAIMNNADRRNQRRSHLLPALSNRFFHRNKQTGIKLLTKGIRVFNKSRIIVWYSKYIILNSGLFQPFDQSAERF